jgi:hypothetical protein
MLQIEESVKHGAAFAAVGLQTGAGTAPQASALPRDTAAALAALAPTAPHSCRIAPSTSPTGIINGQTDVNQLVPFKYAGGKISFGMRITDAPGNPDES